MRPKERRAFFQMAMTGEFRFTVCSIDKTSNDWNSARGTELHWACATTLAVYLQPIYHEAEKLKCPLREPIIVDSNSDSRFLLTVQRAFRGLESKVRHGSSLVGRVTFRKSKPDEMIQLADMVLGAVGTHLDRQDSTWYEMIAARELKTISLP